MINGTESKHSYSELIEAACEPCPPIFNNDKNRHELKQNDCSLEDALSILQETLTTGSRIYLISDFSDLTEKHQSSLLQLATCNDVFAIHITDPAEKKLPEVGTLNIYDINNKKEVLLNTSDASTRRAYREASISHHAIRKKTFNALNIKYKEISTAHNAIETELATL